MKQWKPIEAIENSKNPFKNCILVGERVDAGRVIQWAKAKDRKPACTAFTEGMERSAAYWIEWAEGELGKKINTITKGN